MDPFFNVLIISCLAAFVTTIGIFTINKYKTLGLKNVAYFMCFAAGVLITVSFLHIIPESFVLSKNAPVFLLAGFFLFYIFDRFIKQRAGRKKSIGLIPMFGIGLHSFVDGFIYSITFSVSFFTGILAAIGMIFHEFPEGIVTFVFLVKGGYKRKKAVLLSFLAAAITTPLGALVSFPFISKLKGTATLGSLLAMSAGALVYVGAAHLLPEAHKEEKKHSFLALFAGVLVALVIILSKIH